MKLPRTFAILVFLALSAHQGFAATRAEREAVKPLIQAHAHNDYEHARPLLDALNHGFCSIEADIHLVDTKLLVAHDLKDTKPERTLESLYLEPLRKRAKQNGGRIYPTVPSIILLVDVKSEAVATYAVLDKVLGRYTDILTRFEGTRVQTNAVTVIISGNRAQEQLKGQSIRHAALDGRLPDLQGREAQSLIPLISDNWNNHFKWRGDAALQFDDEQKLRQILKQAHEQGRRVRFWGTPDTVEFWKTLSNAGVDLINADNLSGLRDHLLSNAARSVGRP